MRSTASNEPDGRERHLLRGPTAESPVIEERRSAEIEAEDVDPLVRCAACRHPVTSERQRISVNDAREHRFVNPHGFLFHIGCFRDAPGCVAWGPPTFEFTWFPGAAWCHASCGGCRGHLGWRFDGGPSAVFFGLVLNRLVSEFPSLVVPPV
jgi:hypothetical protein